jgi:hypothetical protein
MHTQAQEQSNTTFYPNFAEAVVHSASTGRWEAVV